MSRRWWAVLVVALVGSLALGFVGPWKETEHVWDLRGFFAAYGFVGGVGIVFVSTWLARPWLQRSENYYEPHRAPAEAGDAGEKADLEVAEGQDRTREQNHA
jgi:type VI protein secretion system component VasK